MTDIYNIFKNETTLLVDKWMPYFDVYERYYGKFRNQNPTFVEVGVWHGGSIEAWVKYFGEGSKIYGIDINPKVKEIPGANIVIADQSDVRFWDKFLNEVGEIDCFLDDGSHKSIDQIITFNKVWPKIKDGGVFICEDTCTSYWDGPFYDGGHNKPGTFMEYVKVLIDYLHIEMTDKFDQNDFLKELTKDIGQIHCYGSQVVFIKGKPKYERVYFNNNGQY